MAVDHNNPQSRDEEILIATIDGTEYDKIPQSRMEELLLELKEVIEAGGGGGTTNYNLLSNKPKINGVTLSGEMTASDLSLVLAEVGKGLSTNDYSDEEKAKVADLLTAIEGILNGSDIDSFGDVEVALLDKADTSDLGTAAAKDSTNSVTAGSTDLVESGAVKDAIDAAVASAYHHAGTKTVAQLTHDLLVAANEGNVYNITDSGTTTSDFIEGIGKTIDEGSNVGICKVGNVYMFDLLSGFVDTTNFVQKSQTAGLLNNDGTVNTTIEDDIDSLKSGLINLDADIDAPNKKNFLQNTATSATQPSGITYTVYDDGSVKVEGEATNNSNFTLNYPFKREGNYILSGCPSGGSTTGYSLEAFLSSSKYVKDTGNGANVTVGNGESWRIRITVASGTVIPEGGITFYPMLRLSTMSDSTFTPYIPSVESRIEAVESGKQDKTDNNLQTTSKTVVGAVNEIKSGLTNVDVALSVPDGTGKNVLPMSLPDIKRCNTYGTWADNVYTYNGITFTVNLDGNSDIASIKATGTASSKADFIIADNNTPNIKAIMNGKSVTLNGCPANGSSATYSINGWQVSATASSARDAGSGVTFNAINMSSSFNFAVSIANGYEIATAGLLFYPMVRLSSVTDPTYAPYIPSVESRIEAVESNLTGNWRQVTFADVFTFAQDVTASSEQNCVVWVRGDRVRIKLFVRGSITTTSTGYKTIGNVSNNYRPANNTIMPGFVNSKSDGTQMLAPASYAINTNGNINLLYGDTSTLGSDGSDWLGGNSILFEWAIK